MIIGRAVTKRSSWCVRCFSVSSVEFNGNRRLAALWGNGDHGRLGHGSLESQWRPNVLPSSAFHNQNLRQIACGGAHSLFLTGSNNILYKLSCYNIEILRVIFCDDSYNI